MQEGLDVEARRRGSGPDTLGGGVVLFLFAGFAALPAIGSGGPFLTVLAIGLALAGFFATLHGTIVAALLTADAARARE